MNRSSKYLENFLICCVIKLKRKKKYSKIEFFFYLSFILFRLQQKQTRTMSNLTKTCIFARNYNKVLITSLRNLSQPASTPPQPSSTKSSSSSHTDKFGLPTGHKPTALERRFLVWTGKYKSLDLVPEVVG